MYINTMLLNFIVFIEYDKLLDQPDLLLAQQLITITIFLMLLPLLTDSYNYGL